MAGTATEGSAPAAVMDSAAVALGTTSGPVAAYVDPGEVAAFALAVNDDDPRYQDGRAVPPTYPVTPALPVVLSLPTYAPEILGVARAIVHGEVDMVLHRPVTPGTRVHTTAERVGAAPSPAGMTVVQVVRTEDDAGDLVAEQHWVIVLVGAATGEARGPAAPDHAFPEAARSRPVGRVTLPTTPDQTFRYAGASGDRSPLHVSDEVARQSGFPRKFNQGLLTLGLVATGLVELAAAGEPDRVARVAARFAAPAFPGDPIELAVYDAGDGAYAFEAHAAGAAVLKHGRVEVRGA